MGRNDSDEKLVYERALRYLSQANIFFAFPQYLFCDCASIGVINYLNWCTIATTAHSTRMVYAFVTSVIGLQIVGQAFPGYCSQAFLLPGMRFMATAIFQAV